MVAQKPDCCAALYTYIVGFERWQNTLNRISIDGPVHMDSADMAALSIRRSSFLLGQRCLQVAHHRIFDRTFVAVGRVDEGATL